MEATPAPFVPMPSTPSTPLRPRGTPLTGLMGNQSGSNLFGAFNGAATPMTPSGEGGAPPLVSTPGAPKKADNKSSVRRQLLPLFSA